MLLAGSGWCFLGTLRAGREVDVLLCVLKNKKILF